MSLPVSNNNPGALSSGGQVLYFPTPAAGTTALIDWLTNNVGTNPNTSLATNNELANYYLNGAYSDGLPGSTRDNPNGNNWLSIVSTANGGNPNNILATAAGIAKAEGGSSVFDPAAANAALGGAGAQTTNTGTTAGGLAGWGQGVLSSALEGSGFGGLLSGLTGTNLGGVGGAVGAAIGQSTAKEAISNNPIGTAFNWLQAFFSVNTGARIVFTILGILLIVLAINFLLRSDQNSEVDKQILGFAGKHIKNHVNKVAAVTKPASEGLASAAEVVAA